jgi:PAS domain S-box-containing protein
MPSHHAITPLKRTDARRFELLVAAVTQYGICMLDPEGLVASWNSGAERITGYRAAEILGQHFSCLFPPEEQASGVPDRMLQDAKRIGCVEAEGWRLGKDGSRFWAMTVVQPVRGPGGEIIGFAQITRDETERRAAAEALSEREERLRLLLEGVVDYAIYMVDPRGVVTNWNAGAQRMKGYTAEAIVGHHFSRFYTREERSAGAPMRNLEVAAREGRAELEGWRVRKDGSRFWASVVIDAIRNDGGKLLGFAKVTRDITERHAAQEALRESERQFRLLVAGVTDYALYMLDPNGIVTSWNVGAERIKGYMADEIVGQHFSRFYIGSDRAAGLPSRALQIAEQEGSFKAEGWRVRKDGSLFWANVVIDPIKDETGRLAGFAKITRDITSQRVAQIALREAQAQRDYAQKMEVLGQLTGGVAHDFNNLLTIVSGNMESIKPLLARDPRAMRAATAIEHAAKRGASLTRQLLTFSRRQMLDPVVVAIAERIEAIRTMLASAVGSTAQIVTTIDPGLWAVKADVSELEIALVNIVLNARDAMPHGGLITVAAENVRLRPDDTLPTLDGEFVAIAISDAGVGIAPDILARVFDPFFTTKQAESGSGLGLSQVQGFAHQSGGTVSIDSELGKGTIVTLYLPRALEEPERALEGPEKAVGEQPIGRRGGRVLLVEDNPEVAKVGASMLEQLGYGVQVVRDAKEALDTFVDRAEFDLVVSDIVMAGAMDGVALASALHARFPELPILLVTGYNNALASTDTSFTVLRKPYNLADLSRAAAKAIAEALQPSSSNLVHLRDTNRGGRPSPEKL